MTSKPLEGYRVLDLTNVLAGPFCCHQLAHMGAEVIKVEVPGTGDLARQLGADPDRNLELMGVSFLAQNPGKRSITVNLKSPEGKDVIKRLVETADVLVENFRPGVMDRLGVGYDVLREINPELIYCAISGFGQDGPLSKLPAYDQIIQGMSGVMAITGALDTAPYRVGYPMADTIGGMTAAFGIATALAKPKPGRGTFLDISMLESVIATMGWVVSNHLIAGVEPAARGNDNFTASPSGTFRTADGMINLSANKQQQFEAVCTIICKPDLANDVRFAKRTDRLTNRDALTAEIEAALTEHPSQHWLDAFGAAGVPAGPVWGVADALRHPQIAERGLLQTHLVDGEELKLVGSAVRRDGQPATVAKPPPKLGADTDAVLREIGYSDEVITQLRADGSI